MDIPIKWKYKVVTSVYEFGDLHDVLEKHGKQCWELCSIVNHVADGYSKYMTLVFKRDERLIDPQP